MEKKLFSYLFPMNTPSFLSQVHTHLFRLERLQKYKNPEEQEALAYFQDHGTLEEQHYQFLKPLVDIVKQGGKVEILRILKHPKSSYSRFELALLTHLAEAGADIRILTTELFIKMGTPEEDFWIVDQKVAYSLTHDELGEENGQIPIEDETLLAIYQKAKDLLWKRAKPIKEALSCK